MDAVRGGKHDIGRVVGRSANGTGAPVMNAKQPAAEARSSVIFRTLPPSPLGWSELVDAVWVHKAPRLEGPQLRS